MNAAHSLFTPPLNGALLVLVQEGEGEERCRIGRWVERAREGYSSTLYRFVPVSVQSALQDEARRLLRAEIGRSPLPPGYYSLPAALLHRVPQQPGEWLTFCFTNITINPLLLPSLKREKRSGRLITLAAYQTIEDTGLCTMRLTATDLTVSFWGVKTFAWEDVDEETGLLYRAFTIKLPGDSLLMYCESSDEGNLASLLDVQ